MFPYSGYRSAPRYHRQAPTPAQAHAYGHGYEEPAAHLAASPRHHHPHPHHQRHPRAFHDEGAEEYYEPEPEYQPQYAPRRRMYARGPQWGEYESAFDAYAWGRAPPLPTRRAPRPPRYAPGATPRFHGEGDDDYSYDYNYTEYVTPMTPRLRRTVPAYEQEARLMHEAEVLAARELAQQHHLARQAQVQAQAQAAAYAQAQQAQGAAVHQRHAQLAAGLMSLFEPIGEEIAPVLVPVRRQHPVIAPRSQPRRQRSHETEPQSAALDPDVQALLSMFGIPASVISAASSRPPAAMPKAAPVPAPVSAPSPAKPSESDAQHGIAAAHAFLAALGLVPAGPEHQSTPEASPSFPASTSTLSKPTDSQKKAAGPVDNAPMRYTYASPASFQKNHIPHHQHPVQPSQPSNVSASEAQRRSDAAAEAQQIMHAINLSLDPANNVQPIASSPVSPSADAKDKGKARVEFIHIPISSPTAIPASSSPPAPASPTWSSASAHSTIDRIETSFAELSADFVFPSHIDFSASSNVDGVSQSQMLYTPNNAPVRAHENALTGLLTKLDAVESEGDEGVRGARKALVGRIEHALEALEVRKREAWDSVKPTSTSADSEPKAETETETETEAEAKEDTNTVESDSQVAGDDLSTPEESVVLESVADSSSSSAPAPAPAPVSEESSSEASSSASTIKTTTPVAEPAPLPSPSHPPPAASTSYPPSLPADSTSTALPAVPDPDDAQATEHSSAHSSPVQVPSDFEPSDAEDDAESAGDDDVPPSMEESVLLEKKTEFILV